MKMRLPVGPIVVSFLVMILSGLVLLVEAPARAALAPTVALIPASGMVSGQPESVKFSGRAQVSSELVLDTSKFNSPPAVILTFDLSNVAGTGSLTGAKYAIGGKGTSVYRPLVGADTVELTFPFSRGTTMSMPSARSGVVSFALNFDLSTGAITSGTANIAAPSFSN
ncbi:MAG TPA: hypothetical protein VFI80_08220 [Burkholderiales bacterium]|nr:hypothetical protein [Burkholderiales bacterium]